MTAPRIIEAGGKQLTLPEWALLSGIKSSTIRMRIDAWGWSIEEAVGLVRHESLRGKCRGKPVTPRYKKEVDRASRVSDTSIKLWSIWK